MSSNLPYKQSKNVERRTWDKEKYEARARERISNEEEQQSSRKQDDLTNGNSSSTPNDHTSSLDDQNNQFDSKEEFQPALPGAQGPLYSKRAYLTSRKRKVDLESKLNTVEIIHPDAISSSSKKLLTNDDVITKSSSGGGVGWYCKVCDCYLKDSIGYLDHINGKKHQRYLGYSMRVEKSTTEQVSNKLKELVQEKEQSQKLEMTSKGGGFGRGRNGDNNNNDDSNEYFEELVRKKDEDILRRKAERARKREERKKRIQQEEKEEVEDDDEERGNELSNNANDGEGNDNEEEEEDDDNNASLDMAAMMGFSGFGSSKR